MQLNDLLEENSIQSISKKTNISEENIERLIQKDFASLKRVKTLGFISILEREFPVDLQSLKEEASTYYREHEDEPSMVLAKPSLDQKRSKSKWLFFVILGLLAYASWYFLTQFDQKHLSDYLPFKETSSKETVPTPIEVAKSLSIENVISEPSKMLDTAKEKINFEEGKQLTNAEVNMTQRTLSSAEKSEPSMVESNKENMENIVISPTGRLWFGLVDEKSRQRDHYSISKKFNVDVRNKSWLVATSSAPFSLIINDETKTFNDAKEHYFRFDKDGIEELSKTAYVQLGGYPKW